MPDLSTTRTLARLRAGTLTAADLMQAHLDRIAADEPRVKAFAAFDPDQAMRAARHARPGPLAGLPIGVKDVLDTADFVSGYGSPIWAGHRPRADAACVAMARAAGGVVIGKTVTTEFATRHPGPTSNPHNAAHTPGGSSSGSAAGVGAGFFPLAFGTQTAGSILRPAAYCGAVGYKPSFGLIPRLGMKLMSDSLDTIGTITRDVAGAALLAAAASGRDLGTPEQRPDAMPRIGICHSPYWPQADAATMALIDSAAAKLVRAGAHVEHRELPQDFADMTAAHPVVMNGESAANMAWELTTRPESLSEVLRERLEWGRAQGPAALDAARSVFDRLQRAFPSAMEGLDILVTPAASGEAPKGLGWTGDPVFNSLWTALHVPCVTVPAGTGLLGLPLGIQIVGRRGEDAATLAWAQFVQSAMEG